MYILGGSIREESRFAFTFCQKCLHTRNLFANFAQRKTVKKLKTLYNVESISYYAKARETI